MLERKKKIWEDGGVKYWETINDAAMGHRQVLCNSLGQAVCSKKPATVVFVNKAARYTCKCHYPVQLYKLLPKTKRAALSLRHSSPLSGMARNQQN